jgi:hypothetical protein
VAGGVVSIDQVLHAHLAAAVAIQHLRENGRYGKGNDHDLRGRTERRLALASNNTIRGDGSRELADNGWRPAMRRQWTTGDKLLPPVLQATASAACLGI